MEQVLIYGDSLTWGIIPTTRHRLPFDQRWPGVLDAELLKQGRAIRVLEDCLNGRRTVFEDPFLPGRNGLLGLAGAYQEICTGLNCHYFDAGTVTTSSRVDGVHLDADQHAVLGKALASVVAEIMRHNAR